MDFFDSFVSVPEPSGFWVKSKFSKKAAKVFSILFVVYVLAVIVWQHIIFWTETTKSTSVYPSAQMPDTQHFFLIGCYDPKGCIVATRRNDKFDNDILNATSNPSDPCNDFKIQYFTMQYNEIRTVTFPIIPLNERLTFVTRPIQIMGLPHWYMRVEISKS